MKTGDRVVCVVDVKGWEPKKDKHYIVSDCNQCLGCKKEFIAVGFSAGHEVKPRCGYCKTFRLNLIGEYFYEMEGFRLVEEKREYRVVKSNVEIPKEIAEVW